MANKRVRTPFPPHAPPQKTRPFTLTGMTLYTAFGGWKVRATASRGQIEWTRPDRLSAWRGRLGGRLLSRSLVMLRQPSGRSEMLKRGAARLPARTVVGVRSCSLSATEAVRPPRGPPNSAPARVGSVPSGWWRWWVGLQPGGGWRRRTHRRAAPPHSSLKSESVPEKRPMSSCSAHVPRSQPGAVLGPLGTRPAWKKPPSMQTS